MSLNLWLPRCHSLVELLVKCIFIQLINLTLKRTLMKMTKKSTKAAEHFGVYGRSFIIE